MSPVHQTEVASYDAFPAVTRTASVRPRLPFHQEAPSDIQRRELYWADCPEHNAPPLYPFPHRESVRPEGFPRPSSSAHVRSSDRDASVRSYAKLHIMPVSSAFTFQPSMGSSGLNRICRLLVFYFAKPGTHRSWSMLCKTS